MSQYLDIIILLVVVVLIFQKLKTLLGTRPDMEERNIAETKATKLIDIINKELEQTEEKLSEIKKEETKNQQSTTEEKTELSETDKALSLIPNFNKENFINSAKKAFELIVTSFSKGDVKTLEMLVNLKLFKKFQEVINQRQNDGITSETDFIGFDSAEITHAEITKNDIAKITVKFISEQVNLLRNKEGEVIEGDEQYIQNITDVWTFERALTSTSPNWLLASTKK